MSIDVLEQAVIPRPRDEVATYASDPTHDTEWIGGIREVHWATDPPLRVGTRVRRLARFAGRTVDYVLEVVDHVPSSRLVMKSVKSPFPMVVTYTFDDDVTGTRVGIRVEGGAGLAFRWFAPVIAKGVARNLRADLRRLGAALDGP